MLEAFLSQKIKLDTFWRCWEKRNKGQTYCLFFLEETYYTVWFRINEQFFYFKILSLFLGFEANIFTLISWHIGLLNVQISSHLVFIKNQKGSTRKCPSKLAEHNFVYMNLKCLFFDHTFSRQIFEQKASSWTHFKEEGQQFVNI